MREWLWRWLLAAVLCLGVGESYRRTVPVETPVPLSPPAEAPFVDVRFGQRWYDGAQYGYRKGIIRGMTETEFGGELPATRAMAATMIWRMAGEPQVLGGSRFSDVEGDRYYTPAVVWGESRGLWRGYGNGDFRPETPVTKTQLELVLGRYMGEEMEVSLLQTPQEGEERPLSRGELAETLMKACEERRHGENG